MLALASHSPNTRAPELIMDEFDINDIASMWNLNSDRPNETSSTDDHINMIASTILNHKTDLPSSKWQLIHKTTFRKTNHLRLR
jgi:hypothetical protein